MLSTILITALALTKLELEQSHISFYVHRAPFHGLQFASDPIGYARTWAWKQWQVVGEGPEEDQQSPVGNYFMGSKCTFFSLGEMLLI